MWPYGPVIRIVHIDYSVYGAFAINGIENYEYNEDIFLEEDKKFLDEIIPKLNIYSASQLVEISHSPGSPWYETYLQKGPKSIIDNELIYKYFKENVHAS